MTPKNPESSPQTQGAQAGPLPQSCLLELGSRALKEQAHSERWHHLEFSVISEQETHPSQAPANRGHTDDHELTSIHLSLIHHTPTKMGDRCRPRRQPMSLKLLPYESCRRKCCHAVCEASSSEGKEGAQAWGGATAATGVSRTQGSRL